MKQFFTKYINNIKNHPEPKKFAKANLILAFLLTFAFLTVLCELGGILRVVFACFIGILIADSLVCCFIARKEAKKNATKKTN